VQITQARSRWPSRGRCSLARFSVDGQEPA